MSRRIARTGVALLAGFLLGVLASGGVAAGQGDERLKVDFRETTPGQGKVGITIAMSGPAWGSGQRLEPDDFSASINGNRVQVTGATPFGEQQGGRGNVAVVLAVDTSGSMLELSSGVPNIDRAKAAADAFTQAMRPGTRLGLVAFSDTPRVVQRPTSDHAAVRTAIAGLTAQGDTALNDAVVQASGLLGQQDGQRNLVVLSDGRDEGSRASRPDAIAAANKADVTAYVVGLNVPGFEQDQQALEELAEGTPGGQAFEVNNADELEGRFSTIGQSLASQYVVELALPPGLGKRVDLKLEVRAGNEVGELHIPTFVLPGGVSPTTIPANPGALPAAPGLSRLESPQGKYVAAIAGFTTVLLAFLLLFGAGSRGPKPYRALRQRLSPYSLTSAIADDQPRVTAFGSSEWAGRATAMAETLVRRGNLEETFLDRLEAAGLNMRVAEFVLISLGSAFIPPLLVLAATRNLLLAAVVVLLGVAGPFLYLSVRASRRQAKFEEQLPSILQLLSGALQAGHSLQQAVDTVVHEAGDPIASEFQRVLTEARLGRPLEEAFEAMARRTRSVDFEWTVMAIRLQRQVGGNLAEVLSTVSQTIRDRYSLKRQIKALSAEGRLSSIILSVLPVLLFMALMIFNPVFLKPLYTTSLGLMMLAGAAVLMIFGVFWLKKITEIKV
ncbi:MAG TPA: VWA domain-containing protein [Actinomycetes bacterium]|jgi:tight adherence protein B|nr:VWA domain-containing protein [Actinomycetes bacterium]